MPTCGIGSGLSFTCDDKANSAGGLKQDFYVGNIGDLDSLSYDGTGNVNSLNFSGYTGLYAFRGVKAKSTAGSNIQRGEGGLPYFPHTVVMTVIDVTPAQKAVLEDLSNSELFIIVPTSTGRFEMYGYPLGLEISEGERNSGESPQDNTTRALTFEGNQPYLEKIVNIPDSDASTGSEEETKAALDSYLV